MNGYGAILNSIKQKQFAPVYYLHGSEGYFIDQIVTAIDEGALAPHETSFNREVFYGADAKAQQVLGACRSFPMMAERRLVILKEAQRMGKPEQDKLASYLKQPVPTTVLVLVYKDARKGLPKAGVTALSKTSGVDFHAKKLYERDIRNWLPSYISSQGFEADPAVADILVTNLGTNIGHLANELEKMFLYLKATDQKRLTKEYVYEQIDIDKEFNVFELINALGLRQANKAHLIIDKMTQNAKLNPGVMIVGGLFRYFHQVALVYSSKLNDANSIRQQLKLNYFQANDALNGRRNYPLAAVYRNIGFIQETDLMLKGQKPTLMAERHLLKTLVWRLLN